MARSGHGSTRGGYTLVEMLIATTLTLVMMGGVATVFGMIGSGVSSARASLEMADALRATSQKLRTDLGGVTVIMNPPRRPEDNEGYFEYTEGPMGPLVLPGWVARNLDRPRTPASGDPDPIPFYQDSTVGDVDDILMFTTRSSREPFFGRTAVGLMESQDAEVAWFVRGRTLYRRQLLVIPPNTTGIAGALCAGFYAGNDISVRAYDSGMGVWRVVPNTLGNLTMPENRFAHQNALASAYPYHPHRVAGWADPGSPLYALARLNLPLLQECSVAGWQAGRPLPAIGLNPNVRTSNASDPPPLDAWTNPHPWALPGGSSPAVDAETGALLAYNGTRVGEDVILSNVIAFDVRAWDPLAPVVVNGAGTLLMPGDPGYSPTLTVVSYGAYVDLGYAPGYVDGSGNPLSHFCVNSYDPASGNAGPRSDLVRVYDTWSLHYESDGIKQTGNVSGLPTDAGFNGFDDDGNGVVDDNVERETQAPYPVPLRGIRVRIRVFEPDSRQIREVTIIHDFLPK